MSPTSIVRVWINPWKYFNATSSMDESEKDSIIDRILQEAEAGNTEALKKFDFVCLENPYFAWRRQRRSGIVSR